MIAILRGMLAPSALLAVRFRSLLAVRFRYLLLPLALAAPLALVALTSCSILPKREPTAIYEPARVTQTAQADWPSANWSLLVARPTASQLYETDRITVRPAPGALQVYKGASWSDLVPNLLQTALVRSFEDSQKIMTVARPGGAVRGEYQLMTEVRSFDSVYVQAGQPQAVVEVHVKLIHSMDGEVVAARTFKEAEPSRGEELGAVVDAFSRSLDRISIQVVGWTLSNGSRHAAASKAR